MNACLFMLSMLMIMLNLGWSMTKRMYVMYGKNYMHIKYLKCMLFLFYMQMMFM